jgi:hypothetical protein
MKNTANVTDSKRRRLIAVHLRREGQLRATQTFYAPQTRAHKKCVCIAPSHLLKYILRERRRVRNRAVIDRQSIR